MRFDLFVAVDDRGFFEFYTIFVRSACQGMCGSGSGYSQGDEADQGFDSHGVESVGEAVEGGTGQHEAGAEGNTLGCRLESGIDIGEADQADTAEEVEGHANDDEDYADNITHQSLVLPDTCPGLRFR